MWLLEWGDIQRAEVFSSTLYLHSRSDFSFSEVETDHNNNLILGQPLCLTSTTTTTAKIIHCVVTTEDLVVTTKEGR